MNEWEQNPPVEAEEGQTPEWAANPPVEETPPKPEGGFISAAVQPLGSMVKGVGQAAEDIATASKLPTLQRIAARTKEAGKKFEEEHAPSVTGFKEVVEHPGQFLEEAAGQGLGQVGVAAGLGMLGKALGYAATKSPAAANVVGTALANVPMFLQDYGQTRERQEEKGETNIPAAIASSTVNTAIEQFGGIRPGLLISPKKLAEDVAEGLAGKTVKEGAKTIAKQAFKGGTSEALEELAQNPIQDIAVGDNPLNPENIQNTLFGAAAAFPAGALFGAGETAFKYRDQKQALNAIKAFDPDAIDPKIPGGPEQLITGIGTAKRLLDEKAAGEDDAWLQEKLTKANDKLKAFNDSVEAIGGAPVTSPAAKEVEFAPAPEAPVIPERLRRAAAKVNVPIEDTDTVASLVPKIREAAIGIRKKPEATIEQKLAAIEGERAATQTPIREFLNAHVKASKTEGKPTVLSEAAITAIDAGAAEEAVTAAEPVGEAAEAKRAEIAPKVVPEAEAPEGVPKEPEVAPEVPKVAPKALEGVPKEPEVVPKALEGVPEALKVAPEVPKVAPKALEGAPIEPQVAPKALEGVPETLKVAPEAPPITVKPTEEIPSDQGPYPTPQAAEKEKTLASLRELRNRVQACISGESSYAT